MINSKTENKFSFAQYKGKNKDQKWDIEHIHAIATDELSEKDLKKWLEDSKNALADNDDLKSTVENLLTSSPKPEALKETYQEIRKRFGILDEDENGLGNLTLLDSGTNRAYKNAIFPVKRNKIIERDRGEVFIPVCTKNVFLNKVEC